MNVVSGAFYILTYENVRHILQNLNVTDSRLRGLIGGGCGSLVGQTIIVPFDVISQRLMMMGQVILLDDPDRHRVIISSHRCRMGKEIQSVV